jgi:hypothetical protein
VSNRREIFRLRVGGFKREPRVEVACFSAIVVQSFGAPRRPFASTSKSTMSRMRNASVFHIAGPNRWRPI